MRPGHVRLHQRHAQALDDAALDLALDERRVDRPPDVVGRDDPAHLHRPELEVDVHLGDLGAEARRSRTGSPWPSASSGVVFGSYAPRPSSTQPRPAAGQLAQLDDRDGRRRPAPPTRPPSSSSVASGPASASVRSWRRRSSAASRVALPDTNVWREAEVLPASGVRSVSGPTRSIERDRHAERVGGDLGEDRVRALADVGRAREQDDGAVGADADLDLGRVGQRRVADAVPHGRRPRRPRRTRPSAASLTASPPRRAWPTSAAAARRGRRAGRRSRRAPGTSRSAIPRGARCGARNSRGSMPSCSARSSMSASWAIAACGHAEAAEGAGRRPVRVHGPARARAPSGPRTGPSRGPGRGWRPSAPTRRRRRCRSRRGRGRR